MRNLSVSKQIKILFWLILVILACFGVYFYWLHNKYHPSTDNSYVGTDVIQIAAQVTGPIIKLYVKNFDRVTKGQPLLDIDPKLYQVAVERAQSQLEVTKQNIEALKKQIASSRALVEEKTNDLKLSEQTYNRTMELVKRRLASVAEGDKATRDRAVARSILIAVNNQLQQNIQQLGAANEKDNAQIRAAVAELKQAKLNLSFTHVIAPENGYIVNLTARVGTVVQANQPIFSIVTSKQWWVDANFKETEIGRIRVGQPATIEVDIYPDHVFHGYVQNISRGSGASFSIFPPENATGNWVKVTQRFPVRIYITDPDPNYPLRIGASSLVTVDTTGLEKNHAK